MRATAYRRKCMNAVEMNFVLPEIEKVGCQSFTACGRVVTRDKSLSKSLSRKLPLTASVKQGRLQRFIRLCFDEGGHLHLDVATPAYFGRERTPKPTHTWLQLQGSLSRFIGQKIQVRAVGVFLLPFERLPQSSLLRAMSFVESKTTTVSMKLTSGGLSVTGAPIQKISWSLENDRKDIEIRLRSTQAVSVNQMYLADLFGVLQEFFQVFVLGDENKAK